MTKTDYIKRLDNFMFLRKDEAKDTINEMMQFECIEVEDQMITLAFPVNRWQLNPVGNMHGGMIATAFDIAMGCVAYIFSDAYHTPTVSMNIEYISAVKPEEILYIKATALHVGKRLAQVSAIAYQKEEILCANASATYIMNNKQ